jgi:hypothetical protein
MPFLFQTFSPLTIRSYSTAFKEIHILPVRKEGGKEERRKE